MYLHSASAFRDFERAVERLTRVSRCLTGEAQKDTLSKIKITVPRDLDTNISGIKETAEAIGAAMAVDMAKYAATAIIKAQDDVRDAAIALRTAIDDDLKISEMRD